MHKITIFPGRPKFEWSDAFYINLSLDRDDFTVDNPNVANVGGLQSQGVEGEVVVLYFEPLTTQNLKSSGVPEG